MQTNKHTHYEVGKREGGTDYAKKVNDVTIQQAFLDGLNTKKKQFEKVEYTLKKIIETVHNDRIDVYGRRLVLINDFAYECLQEIEKGDKNERRRNGRTESRRICL